MRLDEAGQVLLFPISCHLGQSIMMGFRMLGVILGSESLRLEGFGFLDVKALSQFVDQIGLRWKGFVFLKRKQSSTIWHEYPG